MPQAEARKRLSALGLEEEKSLTVEAAIASEVSRDAGRMRREDGGVLVVMHGRSRMTIDPRIPAMLGRKYVGFSPTRQTSLAPNAKRREVFDESPEG